METIYISILFILAAIGGILKVWDWALTRRAIKAEHEAPLKADAVVIMRADWRLSASSLLIMLGLLAPILFIPMASPILFILFLLCAVAALYYFVSCLTWRIVLEEDSFTYRPLSCKERTYRYADVERVAIFGRGKKRKDGARVVLKAGGSVVIDRNMYGLETLELRVKAANDALAAEEQARMEAEEKASAEANETTDEAEA